MRVFLRTRVNVLKNPKGCAFNVNPFSRDIFSSSTQIFYSFERVNFIFFFYPSCFSYIKRTVRKRRSPIIARKRVKNKNYEKPVRKPLSSSDRNDTTRRRNFRNNCYRLNLFNAVTSNEFILYFVFTKELFRLISKPDSSNDEPFKYLVQRARHSALLSDAQHFTIYCRKKITIRVCFSFRFGRYSYVARVFTEIIFFLF